MQKILGVLIRVALLAVLIRAAIPAAGQVRTDQLVAVQGEQIRHMDSRLDYIEKKLDSLDLSSRLSKMEYRLEEMHKSYEDNQRMLRGLVLAAVAAAGKELWKLIKKPESPIVVAAK